MQACEDSMLGCGTVLARQWTEGTGDAVTAMGMGRYGLLWQSSTWLVVTAGRWYRDMMVMLGMERTCYQHMLHDKTRAPTCVPLLRLTGRHAQTHDAAPTHSTLDESEQQLGGGSREGLGLRLRLGNGRQNRRASDGVGVSACSYSREGGTISQTRVHTTSPHFEPFTGTGHGDMGHSHHALAGHGRPLDHYNLPAGCSQARITQVIEPWTPPHGPGLESLVGHASRTMVGGYPEVLDAFLRKYISIDHDSMRRRCWWWW